MTREDHEMTKKEKMIKITFRPQAWVNDNTIDVDPQGPTEFEVPVSMVKGIDAHSYESDELRGHRNCPLWAQDWAGPFECEWDEEDPALKD